jgi:hypothetical protein
MEEKILNFTGKIEFIEGESEAFAGISLNKNITWGKVIITDDKPNANKHRIPQSEFANIIRTGINTPIKMAVGEVSSGHLEAFGHPIGVITQMKEDKNRVLGLLALWNKERPEDIKLLKEMSSRGETPEVSWELSYTDEEEFEEYTDLTGVSLDGIAIVGEPAYAGRTPIYALAEKENKEDKTLDELEKIKTELAEANDKVEKLDEKVKELEAKLAEKDSELSELQEYKQEIEAAKERENKLLDIQAKFKDASLEKDDEYFEQNAETLLALSPEALEFMIQELVAFSEASEKTDAGDAGDVPPMVASKIKNPTKDLVSLLRAYNSNLE